MGQYPNNVIQLPLPAPKEKSEPNREAIIYVEGTTRRVTFGALTDVLDMGRKLAAWKRIAFFTIFFGFFNYFLQAVLLAFATTRSMWVSLSIMGLCVVAIFIGLHFWRKARQLEPFYRQSRKEVFGDS